MTCSLVIPTKNRPQELRSLLQSLRPHLSFFKEVIVVNDGGQIPPTITRTYPEITWVEHTTGQGPSSTRNHGASRASGTWLLFVDDDCLFPSDFVNTLEEVLKKSIDGCYGTVRYKPLHTAAFPEKVVDNNKASWPMGALLLMKRDVFTKLQGFDAQFDEYHNEDTALVMKAIEASYRIVPAPEILIEHQGAYWTTSSLWKSRMNMSVWPLLVQAYPTAASELRYDRFGPFMRPFEWFLFFTAPVTIPLLFLRFQIRHPRAWRHIHLFLFKYFVVLAQGRLRLWGSSIRTRQWFL